MTNGLFPHNDFATLTGLAVSYERIAAILKRIALADTTSEAGRLVRQLPSDVRSNIPEFIMDRIDGVEDNE